MILTNGQRAILAMYYGFTSLSSVGFGDFHPINSQERLICAVILVAGNAVFGYIIGIFKEMVEKSKDLLNDQFEEAYELISFFSMLQKFNNNRMIKKTLEEQITNYFEYRWASDRARILRSEMTQTLLQELPDSYKMKLYKYLFSDFLQEFRSYFTFYKMNQNENIN